MEIALDLPTRTAVSELPEDPITYDHLVFEFNVKQLGVMDFLTVGLRYGWLSRTLPRR